MFHCRRTFVSDRCSNQWRCNHDCFAAHFSSGRFGGKIDIQASLKSISLHWFATYRAQLVIIRTLVYDRRVVVSDVRDVGRLIDNRAVALRW